MWFPYVHTEITFSRIFLFSRGIIIDYEDANDVGDIDFVIDFLDEPEDMNITWYNDSQKNNFWATSL
jgi:hypothetical protein